MTWNEDWKDLEPELREGKGNRFETKVTNGEKSHSEETESFLL